MLSHRVAQSKHSHPKWKNWHISSNDQKQDQTSAGKTLKSCSTIPSIWRFWHSCLDTKRLDQSCSSSPATCSIHSLSLASFHLRLSSMAGGLYISSILELPFIVVFIASENDHSGPPYKDSNPATCLLASAVFGNLGARLHKRPWFLYLSCLQNRQHVVDHTAKLCC